MSFNPPPNTSDTQDQPTNGSKVLNYYEKYSQNKNLPKYFCGSPVAYMPNIVPPTESPTSSVEWDNGADIGCKEPSYARMGSPGAQSTPQHPIAVLPRIVDLQQTKAVVVECVEPAQVPLDSKETKSIQTDDMFTLHTVAASSSSNADPSSSSCSVSKNNRQPRCSRGDSTSVAQSSHSVGSSCVNSTSSSSWKHTKTRSEMMRDMRRQVRPNNDDQLVDFAHYERKNQLNWIRTELSYLRKLKSLLEQKVDTRETVPKPTKTTTVYKVKGSGPATTDSPARNYVIETELERGGGTSSSGSGEFRIKQNGQTCVRRIQVANDGDDDAAVVALIGDIEVHQTSARTTNIRIKANVDPTKNECCCKCVGRDNDEAAATTPVYNVAPIGQSVACQSEDVPTQNVIMNTEPRNVELVDKECQLERFDSPPNKTEAPYPTKDTEDKSCQYNIPSEDMSCLCAPEQADFSAQKSPTDSNQEGEMAKNDNSKKSVQCQINPAGSPDHSEINVETTGIKDQHNDVKDVDDSQCSKIQNDSPLLEKKSVSDKSLNMEPLDLLGTKDQSCQVTSSSSKCTLDFMYTSRDVSASDNSTTTISTDRASAWTCMCCKKSSDWLLSMRKERTCRLCRRCYANNRRNMDKVDDYMKPTHTCNCYVSVNANALAEIKQTIAELSELESSYRSHSHSHVRRRNPRSVAYLLSFVPDTDARSTFTNNEKVKPRKKLEEVKVKIPVKPFGNSKKRNVGEAVEAQEKAEALPVSVDDENAATAAALNGTLQEFLCKNRPQFVRIAEHRRQIVDDLREIRKDCSEENKQNIIRKYLQSKRQHVFSARDIREINRRNYKKLPEVREKAVERRKQEIKRNNRIIVNIFNSKLREVVLKGKRSLSTDVQVTNL